MYIIMDDTCTHTSTVYIYIYIFYAESVKCSVEVDEFATNAILRCSDPPFDVDIMCILPTQEINC